MQPGDLRYVVFSLELADVLDGLGVVVDFAAIPRATLHTGLDDLVVAIAQTRGELAAMSSK